MTDSPDKPSAGDEADQPERRNFVVAMLAVAVGGITGLFGLVSGLFVFFDPLIRNNKVPKFYQDKEGGDEGWVPIAKVDAIPDDGTPVRFPVIMDVVDAWTFSPDQPVGAVYVRMVKGDPVAIHTTCPHAGCSVSHTAEGFHCPCHNSVFDLNGEKIDVPGKENPSPRNLDLFESSEGMLKVDDDGNILIKFENYYTGVHEKKAKI